MTAKYYVTLTDYGASLVAQAHDIASIQLTQLVVGDANGIPYEPIAQKSRIALVNQKAAVPVQSVAINGTVTTVTATLEANIGGFNLHEIGLKDNTGKLVYIGNYHGGYKAVIEEGAGGELTIIIDITAESGKDALISIDPNVVTANKQWALDNFVRIPTFEQHVIDNTNQHNDFQNQIINEAQARDEKDYDLQLQVWQEGTLRSDADTVLQQQIDNLQQQIYSANTRIALLEDHELYRVGDLFISTTLFVHAGEVHAHIGYGTWERFGDGHALVAAAFSNENGAPPFMLTPGATGGEYSHVLTIDEMPEHSHKLGDSAGTSGTGRTPDLNSSPPDTMNTTDAIGMTGGGMAHNNIQPSITVCVWKRVS